MSAEIVREYRAGASKTRHGTYVGLALVAIGAWLFFLAGDSVPDRELTGLAMCGLGVAVGGYAWWTGRKVEILLRLDKSSIWFKEWGIAVPWSGVRDVVHTGHKLQPFVTIKLADSKAFLASLSEAELRGLKGNRLWKDPDLRIPNGAVNAPQAELLDVMRKMKMLYG